MRKEIICKYITIDGKEFGNEKDARVHEISLRYKRELANIDHKIIGRYKLYKISTVDELDSLCYYYDRMDCIGEFDDYKMPSIMCCIRNKDLTKFEILHINNLVKQMTEDADRLKEMWLDLHNEGGEFYKCKKGKDNK